LALVASHPPVWMNGRSRLRRSRPRTTREP
jgi:hypothetical protein